MTLASKRFRRIATARSPAPHGSPTADSSVSCRLDDRGGPKYRLLTVIRGLAIVIAVVATVAASGGARAAQEDADALLSKAEKLYEALEYEAALRLLIQVHRHPKVTAIQRARAYLYMGVCFTALGKVENAVQSFMEVLKLRPKFRLPAGVSPSIRATFAAALKRLQNAGGLKSAQKGGASTAPRPADILVRAPHELPAGKPLELKIEVEDPRRLIRTMLVRYKRKGQSDFSTLKLDYDADKAVQKATVPATSLGEKKGRLDFYVLALSKDGKKVAHHGSEDEPKHVILTASPAGNSSVTWWIVGGVGAAAVIAGSIVGGILIANALKGPEGPPPNTAGVTVTVR